MSHASYRSLSRYVLSPPSPRPPRFHIRSTAYKLRPLQRRTASTTSDPNKPIVLEQPDKFRPPSHPQRLNRRPPRHYGPSLSEEEIAAQKTKRYPNTFPNEGTPMHRFLTNRKLHLFITLSVLATCATLATLQNFLHTSPYAHLLPPLSTLPRHPVTFATDFLSILKLHQDYATEQAGQRRRNAILDVQKQRLYRRAHGIEDLDREEEHGVDVRGIVPWDDGLTTKERAAGGRDEGLTRRMVHEMVVPDGRGGWEKMGDRAEKALVEEGRGSRNQEDDVVQEEVVAVQQQQSAPQQQQRRRGHRWFGIWG